MRQTRLIIATLAFAAMTFVIGRSPLIACLTGLATSRTIP